MNEFAKFASRYHKLKRDLQGLEESEHTRILTECTALESQIADLDTVVRQSKSVQAGILNIHSWNDYATFQVATSLQMRMVESELSQAERALVEQKERLRLSYIEQEKWSSISSAEREAVIREENRKMQIAADDDAMKRYWKGEV